METQAKANALTPYGAAKLVNEWLAAKGIEKKIPTQMMYNYTTARVRKGKAPFIEVDEEGRVLVASLEKWFEKYSSKR